MSFLKHCEVSQKMVVSGLNNQTPSCTRLPTKLNSRSYQPQSAVCNVLLEHVILVRKIIIIHLII